MHKAVKTQAYENNPFFIAINGLEILFKKAQAIGIALAVVALMSVAASLPAALIPPVDDHHSSAEPVTEAQIAQENQQFAEDLEAVPVFVWVLLAIFVVTIMLVAIFIGIVLAGVTDYTSARLAHGHEVGLSEALRALFSHFWGYTWVLIVMGFKIFLWSLLFIIPGLIMSVRYSLAGVVYFDKKIRGNAAVKESARLTKGGWLTTFASHSLFNLLTGSMIAPLLVPGTQAILYRQFEGYDKAKLEKPKAHVVSWLTLIIPLALAILFALLFVALLALFAHS